MEIIIFDYKISPYSGDTCWKIQKRQDKEGMKLEWRDPNYFPSTLDQALKIVRELVRRGNKKQFKSVTEALKELEAIDAKFSDLLSSLKNTYPGNFAD